MFSNLRMPIASILMLFTWGTLFAQTPDLTVSNVSAPGSASMSSFITVTWTTSNIGTGPSGAGFLFDGIYLSTDQNFDPLTDMLLTYYFHASPIGAGASEEDSTIVLLPDSVTGDFYVYVNTDELQSVSESNESNNFAHSGIMNISSDTFDLQVTSVSAPGGASSNQDIQISYTVANIGTSDMTDLSWMDAIYLSSDTIFGNGDDVVLGSVSLDTSLAAGDSYTRSPVVSLPSALGGTYRIFVETNYFNFILEQNTSNNRGISLPIDIDLKRPDLIVSQISPPDTVKAGDKLRFSYQIKNDGDTSTNAQQWEEQVFISSDSLAGDDTLLTIHSHTVNLAPGGSITINDSLILPFALPKGVYHIVIVCDPGNVISELNDTNNTNISARFFYGYQGPDLAVTHVQTPATAFSGQQIQISWIVSNIGTLGTGVPQWIDRVYLSPSPVFDESGSSYLATFENPSYLGPGEGYANTKSVTLPNGIDGNYYIFVLTDIAHQVPEMDETNNTGVNDTAMHVTLAASPDLIVSAFTKPATGFSGEEINISMTVKNDGNGVTGNSNWLDAVYLTQDSVLDKNTAHLLSWYSHNGILPPESSYTRTDQVDLPHAISGKYYIYAVTDVYNYVYEYTAESNNIRRDSIDIILTPPPDLVVTAVSGPLNGNSGRRSAVSWTVQNQGSTSPFEPSWEDRLYISHSASFQPESSFVLGTFTRQGTIFPDSSYTRTDSVFIPDGLSGQYYIYAKTDWKNNVFEHLFEGNNVTRSAGTSQIQLSPWPDLDLVSLTYPPTPTAGQHAIVSWSVTNSGLADIAASRWSDKVYISSSATWDSINATLLTNILLVPPLLSSGSYTQTAQVTLPPTISGTGYFYFITDAGNAIYEHTGEGNNIERSAAVLVQPYPPIDLSVGNIVTPPAGSSGTDVHLQFSVQNIGPGKTLESKWYDAVYLSADTLLSTDQDSLLIVVRRQGTLDAGESYGRDLTVRLPDAISGNFYFLMKADTGNTVGDSDVSNNIRHSQSQISVLLSPSPDLHVMFFSAPTAGTSGQPIKARWTVQNGGPGQTRVPSWNDALFISTDLFLDPADTRLETRTHSGAINAGASYDDSLDVTIPNYVSGDLFLLLQTDSKNVVYEQTGEGNNTYAWPFTVTIATPSDLIVSGISMPDSAIAGEDLTLSWTIRNQGANPAIGWLRDAVYLSSDSQWEVSDPLFGVFLRYINLAPGASMTAAVKGRIERAFLSDSNGSLKAPAPGFSPGNYHAIVRADIRNNIHESIESNNTSASTDTMHIDVPSLQLGVPSLTALRDGEQQFYRVDIAAGKTLKVTLDGSGTTGSLEMYARYGAVPSRSNFDAAYASPFSPDQVITIAETEAGTYYILLFADRVTGDSISASIMAQDVIFSVTSVTPSIGGNSGDVTVSVEGARFSPGSTIKLAGSGGAQPRLIRSTYIDASRIDATFDMTGNLPLGAYDVVVRRPDSSEATLAAGFILEPGKGLTANLGFGPPRAIQRSRSGFYTISIDNTTNVDLPFLTAYILIPAGQSFTVNSSNMRTLSQSIPPALDTLLNHQDYFDEGGWRYIPLTARNVRVGQRLNIALRVNDVQGFEFPVQIAVDAVDRREFVEGQLLYLELFRQALLQDTSGKYAPEFFNLAQNPEAFIGAAMPVYVDLGILTPSDISVATPALIQKTVGQVAQMPLSPAKLRALFSPALTTCQTQANWIELGGRLALIGFGLLTGALLAPITLSLGLLLAVGSAIGFAMNVGAIVNGTPGLLAKLTCWDTPVVSSLDPNDIIGPAGFGERKWVAVTQTMTYTVRFENDPKLATAPAQRVTVDLNLDSTLDVRSFRLGEFGFGSFTSGGAANQSHYTARMDVRDSLGVFVDVSAGVDVDKNKAFWSFSSIDPATGEAPANPLAGFLPVDDSLHRGEGFVTFSVRPKAGSHTGDSVRAKARIVFDVNDPIDTPPVFNTIDAGLPGSVVRLLPPATDTTTFLVKWGGSDDSAGSGVKNYNIFVSRNDSPFVPWLTNVSDTVANFTGFSGDTYGFFSLAADNSGNIEPAKSSADAVTVITGIAGFAGGNPKEFRLYQNYPNPFNPATTIRYQLAKRSQVSLKVYNVLGQEVASLVNEAQEAGYREVKWNASNFASGVYFYKLQAGTFGDVKKLLIVK